MATESYGTSSGFPSINPSKVNFPQDTEVVSPRQSSADQKTSSAAQILSRSNSSSGDSSEVLSARSVTIKRLNIKFADTVDNVLEHTTVFLKTSPTKPETLRESISRTLSECLHEKASAAEIRQNLFECLVLLKNNPSHELSQDDHVQIEKIIIRLDKNEKRFLSSKFTNLLTLTPEKMAKDLTEVKTSVLKTKIFDLRMAVHQLRNEKLTNKLELLEVCSQGRLTPEVASNFRSNSKALSHRIDLYKTNVMINQERLTKLRILD